MVRPPPAVVARPPALGAWSEATARALLLGQRLDLRALSRDTPLALAPLVLAVGADGVAVLFRYGAVVLFHVAPDEERVFLAALGPCIEEPLATPEREVALIRTDVDGEERIAPDGVIHLRALSIERLQLIADVLAKSVALAHDETRIAAAFDRIEPVAATLRRTARPRLSSASLLAHIGDVLITQHRVVGRVEVTEKPDLLWDRPELERLYLRLEEEYELPERDRALDRKLDVIGQTARTALGMVQARQSLRVEWYIVLLIMIEIVLTLYELFIVPKH